MKKLQKLTSILLVLILMVSLIPMPTQAATKTVVESRMASIVKKYPDHSVFNEWVSVPVNPSFTYEYGGCNGLVAYVTRKIFHNPYFEGSPDYQKVGSASTTNTTKMKNLFKDAKFGDVIAWTRNGYGAHFAIFLSDNSNGVYIYEANFGDPNEVWYNHFWPWKAMKDWPYGGADQVSVYRSKNYNAVNNKTAAVKHGVGKVLTIDEGNDLKVQVLNSTISGGTVMLLDGASESASIPYAVMDTNGYVSSCYHKSNCTACDANSEQYFKVIRCKNAKATATGLRTVEISWDKMTGVTGYQVYRSTSKNGTYSRVKSCTGSGSNSYEDTDLTPGQTYYYKVRGYKTSGGKTYYSNFTSVTSATPKPKKVANVKATGLSNNRIQVTWDKQSGVSGYEVYRADTEGGTYTKVKTITSSSTVSHINTKRTLGQKYYYKVRSYWKNADGDMVYGSFSGVKSAAPKPAAPKVTKVTSTYTSVTLNWDKVDGCNGYGIYRSTSKNGTYSFLARVSGGSTLSYKNTGLTTGKTYYYKVRAYSVVDGERLYGAYSDIVSRTPKTSAPTIGKVTSTYNSVTLNWNKISGASGYGIYRSTSKNGTYSFLARVSGGSTLSYKNTGLTTGKTYYYKVRSYRTVNGERVYSASSDAVSRTPKLFTPTISKTTSTYNSVTVNWNKVSGASGYSIYRSTSENGTYSFVKRVSGNSTVSYKNTGLTTGKTYYYKVAAYRTVNGERVYGNKSKAYAATPRLSKTKGVSIGSATKLGKLSLSWDKVSGASGYQIYRSTSKSGTYTRVKTVTGGSTLSYTNSGLAASKTYYYKVRAYRNVGDKTFYGSYSDVVSKKTKAGKILLSQTKVAAKDVTPVTIKVTFTGNSINALPADPNVVAVEWGNWAYNSDTIALTLYPVMEGKTTIKIWDADNEADYRILDYSYQSPIHASFQEFPVIVHHYDDHGESIASFRVDGVLAYLEKNYEGTHDIVIKYSGVKLSPTDGPSEMRFMCVLKDKNGKIVSSLKERTDRLYPNEDYGSSFFFSYVAPGDYTIEFVDYRP